MNASGLFRWLEDGTIDLRFRYGRWQPEKLGDQLALVAIDDASLDTIGRWPWQRAWLAQAAEEISRAGAKTMAFDILFIEPEEGTTGDEALAAAMARTPTVFAMSVREDKVLDPMWETPAGEVQLAALAKAVSLGIDHDMKVVIEEAGLKEPYRSKVLERPAAFKGLAAWLTLEQLRKEGKLPGSFEEFVAKMLGGGERAARMGDFGERKLLERVWLRGESWRAIQGKILSDAASKGTPLDLPPIPMISKVGSAAGVVNAEPDPFDGKLRRVAPFFPTDYGRAPQFGLIAGLVFQGRTVQDAKVEEQVLRIGSSTIPLRSGKVLLDWPTQLLSGYGNTDGRNATVSIGRLIEQFRARQKIAEQDARLQGLGGDIATGLLGQTAEWFAAASKDGRLRNEIQDLWKNDYAEHAADADLPPDQKQAVASLQEWMALDKAVGDGRAMLVAGDLQLRDALGGKLVFIGFTATGVMADMINTIFGARTPGIFGHIVMADMVLNGRSLEFAPAWVAPIAILLLGLVSTLTAARFGAGVGAVVVFLVLSTYIVLPGVVGFDRWEWICPLAAPVASGFGGWIATTVAVAVITQREKQRVTRQFRARVSPQLVDMLAKNPDALSMSGVERESTILFGDLAGFTTISETLGGPAVVHTLNLYMGAMTKELTARRAYVNKFLGDGILAFWSAFAEEPEQGRLAVEAALACQKVVKEIGQQPDRQGLPTISLRLGMATGKVVIGDCGAPPDLNDYTMIGDSANLAARLESANKQFGSAILIDGRTAELAKESGLALLSLGKVVVVGQSVPIQLYEVCLEEHPEERMAQTEAMVKLFGEGKFEECRKSLADIEKSIPGSKKLVHAFLDAIDNPEDLRDGVLRLRAK
ncbi:MAG: adenylate/guanylate cyclase domain-containing protein [Planctomycetes bacterium]|nr:adenylate/guanylate cyclase domain-containing protein [Planctomycetota bacterium]